MKKEAITAHDYEGSYEDEGEYWKNYRYPFHEDLPEDAYNDV